MLDKLKKHFTLRLLWYDMWIGAYWDRSSRCLYVCPLPMICIRFYLSPKNKKRYRRWGYWEQVRLQIEGMSDES